MSLISFMDWYHISTSQFHRPQLRMNLFVSVVSYIEYALLVKWVATVRVLDCASLWFARKSVIKNVKQVNVLAWMWSWHASGERCGLELRAARTGTCTTYLRLTASHAHVVLCSSLRSSPQTFEQKRTVRSLVGEQAILRLGFVFGVTDEFSSQCLGFMRHLQHAILSRPWEKFLRACSEEENKDLFHSVV